MSARMTARRAARILIAAATLGAGAATAQDGPTHGISAFGELRYGPDFEHFDYVNPDAPRGGTLRLPPTTAARTFEHFNPVIFEGSPAAGVLVVYDTLMIRAFDEPDAMYGLLAESVAFSEDGRAITFRLRPEARFSDGAPVTSEDVAWSIEAIRDGGRPNVAQGLIDVVAAETPDAQTVVFRLAEGAPRRVVFNIARLPIFQRAWYEDADRDFATPTLDLPVGSGPYQVGRFEPRRFIEYERRDDYWADDLPAMRGQYNFATLRYEYFLDDVVALEAFSADEYDVREEFRSASWATAYDFPAVEDGRVVRELIPDGRPAGTQGYFFNLRRERFQDARVREALGLMFDFELTNAQLFYDLYTRTDSFFENSDLEPVEGPPSGAVLALLEPYRDQLPAETFETLWSPNVTRGDGNMRREIRRARALFEEAGWTVDDSGVLRNSDGEPFEIEFLQRVGSGFTRINQPMIDNLQRLGVQASIREVDPAQYEELQSDYDFDVVTARLPILATPGPELRGYLGSDAVDTPGGFNLAGIADPVVDALLEEIAQAESRAELQAAGRALDRVIRANRYWTPQWSRPFYPMAWWDRFGRPSDLGVAQPPYNRGIVLTWWSEPERPAGGDAASD